QFDERLYKEDITGSIAHAKMLGKQGIISDKEAQLIIKTLEEILEDIEAGKVEFTIESEDIHMNIESILTERIGDTGKKLHTARSRNDQVNVDIRLYLKKETDAINQTIQDLLAALSQLAKEHVDTVMPGYTHLQRAQPVTFAYHLLAYYQMFSRDKERFCDCLSRIDRLPLGSGALAGTTYNTDRDFLAEELGFSSVLPNGMDAVADRDFAIEFINCCAITMMHLSRFCEELIQWSSVEFGFIEIDDSFSTGSSIMPQKKNPDMAELIRGKSGRVYGDLMSLLTICKGLPLAYNKDLQEDKIPVFDAADTLKASMSIFREMILTMQVKKENMEKAAKYGYMNATDAADYLVSKGIPFRDCHEIIGKIVLYCIEKGIAIEDMSMEEFKSFSPKFEDDIYEKIDIRNCIKAKKSKGSTSFESVKKQLEDISKNM
ncbi:MAG: argininosuccinate lyase, partial [Anaerovoracaceae bacterium]